MDSLFQSLFSSSSSAQASQLRTPSSTAPPVNSPLSRIRRSTTAGEFTDSSVVSFTDLSSTDTQEVQDVLRRSDDEILAEFGGLFCVSEDSGFDPVRYALSQLADQNITDNFMENELYEFERALELISTDISARVLGNLDGFVHCLEEIRNFTSTIKESIEYCSYVKNNVTSARTCFQSGVMIAAYQRRKTRYEGVINVMNALLEICEQDKVYQSFVEEEDFPNAVISCEALIALLKPFLDSTKSVEYVETKSQLLTQQLAELRRLVEQSSLFHIVNGFVETEYISIVRSYATSNSLSAIPQKLLSIFINSISDKTYEVLSKELKIPFEEVEMRSFQELAKLINPSDFFCVLKTLLETILRLLRPFYQLERFHKEIELNKIPELIKHEKELRFDFLEMKTQIANRMNEICLLVLNEADMTQYQIEEVLQIMSVVNQFLLVCNTFSCRASAENDELINIKKGKLLEFFKFQHLKRLEALRTMLLNERWQKIPGSVSVNDIPGLDEFINISSMNTKEKSKESSETILLTPFSEIEMELLKRELEQMKKQFVIHEIEDEEEKDEEETSTNKAENEQSLEEKNEEQTDPTVSDPLSNGEDFKAEETVHNEPKHLTLDELLENTINCVHYVIPTGINFAKSVEKYLSFMKQTSSIASDIFNALVELFTTFIVAIHSCATNEIPQQQSSGESFLSKAFFAQQNSVSQINFLGRVAHYPSPPNLHSRLLAAETLSFGAHIAVSIKSALEYYLTTRNNRNAIDDFYDRIIKVIPFIRMDIFRSASPLLLTSFQKVPEMITKLNWEHPTDERVYTNSIVKELNLICVEIDKLVEIQILSTNSISSLNEFIATEVMEILFRGYSRVEKCSVEGRAMMIMDVTVIAYALEVVVKKKPIPGLSDVMTFLKASYLSEREIIDFCKRKKELNSKQLLNVFHSSEVGKKMSKKDFNITEQLIEDIGKSHIHNSISYLHLQKYIKEYSISTISDVSFRSHKHTESFSQAPITKPESLPRSNTSRVSLEANNAPVLNTPQAKKSMFSSLFKTPKETKN